MTAGKGDVGAVCELARAKVNLTLRILGRRPDGYHELESLVAFADVGDAVRLVPGAPPDVIVSGGAEIVGANIVERALDAIAFKFPDLTLGRVEIEKQLPVASGLGGGSANAAAAMRAVRRANPNVAIDQLAWFQLARDLGADVPVCLLNRAAWMTGIGENLRAIEHLPALYAVLANPMADVPANKTALVFEALGAHAFTDMSGDYRPPPTVQSTSDIIQLAKTDGNDLEAAAIAVVEAASKVRSALRATPSVRHVALSGAGPTLFAIYDQAADAAAARADIARHHPDWWVVATRMN